MKVNGTHYRSLWPTPDGAVEIIDQRVLPHAFVTRALREGASRIDTAALPDEIVVMKIPESGRSSKVDKRALRALLEERDAPPRAASVR